MKRAYALLALIILASTAAHAQWPMFRNDPARTGAADPGNDLGFARPKPAWIFPAYVTAPAPVDNASASGFATPTGSWTLEPTGGYNDTYLYVGSGGSAATATWTFNITSAADFLIYVWFPSESGTIRHITDAHYIVSRIRGGVTTELGRYTLDQSSGGAWLNLGYRSFETALGDQLQVTLTNQTAGTTGRRVIADAVKLETDAGSVLASPVVAQRGAGDEDDLLITSRTETRYMEASSVQSGTADVGVVYGLFTEKDADLFDGDERGTKAWSFPLNPNNWIQGGISSTPLVTTVNLSGVDTELAIIPAMDGQVYAVRTADGTLAWQGPGYILNDPNTPLAAAWTPGNHSGYQGNGYFQAQAAAAETTTATWDFTLDKGGKYAVYAWIPPSTTAETYIYDASYTITYGSTTVTATVDQQYGGHWVRVGGDFTFAAGAVTVTLSNQTGVAGTVYVAADAVKIVPAELGAFDLSSPVAESDGTIYVGSTAGRVYALSLDSNDPVWTYPDPAKSVPANAYGDPDYPAPNPIGAIYASPTLDNTDADPDNHVLYIGTTDGHVYALNAATGAREWSYPYLGPDPSDNITYYALGEISSTAVVDGLLYVSVGGSGSETGFTFDTSGRVVALDPDLGPAVGRTREQWWYPNITDDPIPDSKGSFLYSSPLLTKAAGQFDADRLVVGSTDGSLYAVDPTTGAELWDSALNDTEIYSSPAGARANYSPTTPVTPPFTAVGDAAYIGTLGGRINGVTLSDGTRHWYWELLGGAVASPIIHKERIYIADDAGYTWCFSTKGDSDGNSDINDGWNPDNGMPEPPTGGSDVTGTNPLTSQIEVDVLTKAQYDDFMTKVQTETAIDPATLHPPVGTGQTTFEWGEDMYIVAWNLIDPNYVRTDPPSHPLYSGITADQHKTDSDITITLKSRAPGDQSDSSETLHVEDSDKDCFKNAADEAVYFAKLVYRIDGSAGGKTQTPGTAITISAKEVPAKAGDASGESVVPVDYLVGRDSYAAKEFAINNPLGLAYGGSYVGVDTLWQTSRNIGYAGANGNESLVPSVVLDAPNGTPHGSNSGVQTPVVVDRSLLGVTGGVLSKVRVERRDLLRPYGTPEYRLPWDDMPPAAPGLPNVSVDYPDIDSRNLNCRMAGSNVDVARDAVTLAGTDPVTPVTFPAAGAPWEVGRNPMNVNVSVPRFQPPAAPYIGRVYVYVDSNNNGRLELPGQLGTRRLRSRRISGAQAEAYREFDVRVGVPVDRRVEMHNAVLDIGQVPHGFGWTPEPDGTPHYFGYVLADIADDVPPGVGYFADWAPTFAAENVGNVNLTNVKLATTYPLPGVPRRYLTSDTVQAPENGITQGFYIDAWECAKSSLHENYLDDAQPPLWPTVAVRTLHKARVGDQPTQLTVPDKPYGYGATVDAPHLSIAVPIGQPAGTYTGTLSLYNDDNSNGTYDVATESVGDPPIPVAVTVTEARLTDGATPGSKPHLDAGAPNGSLSGNRSPVAYINPETGNMYLAFASNRYAATPGPTDPWYLYMTKMVYEGNRWKFDLSDSSGRWMFPTNDGTASMGFRFPPTGMVDELADGSFFPDPPDGANGDTVPSSVKFGNPSIVCDYDPYDGSGSKRAWLMFTGEAVKDVGGTGTHFGNFGKTLESRGYYVELTDPANTANVTLDGKETHAVTSDWTMPKFGLRGAASRMSSAGNPLWLWSFWYGGNNDKWRIFYTTNPFDVDGWRNATQIDLPPGLTSMAEPSPVFRGNLGGILNADGTSADVMELVYSGYSPAHGNSDIYLSRFTPDRELQLSRGKYVSLKSQPFPLVKDEALSRLSSNLFGSEHVDWKSDFHIWVQHGNPTVSEQVYPFTGAQQETDPSTGAIACIYPDGSDERRDYRALLIDPTAGTVKFLKPPAAGYKVVASYTPQTYRLTTDGASDVSPFALLDGDKNPRWINGDPAENPFYTPPAIGWDVNTAPRTDRLWLFWRRPGMDGKPGTGIHYKSYRHAVQLGNQMAKADVTVEGATAPVEIDWVRNMLYFTGSDEGKSVTVTYTLSGETTPGPAETHTVRLMEDSIGGRVFGNLTRVMVNEGQISAFKDPNSNKIWCFWSSTRSGNTDIYYEAISPRFYGEEYSP
ncbi:MAG: golvesin C-terminal-like domain-containing protein [Armatimonadota bacterium]